MTGRREEGGPDPHRDGTLPDALSEKGSQGVSSRFETNTGKIRPETQPVTPVSSSSVPRLPPQSFLSYLSVGPSPPTTCSPSGSSAPSVRAPGGTCWSGVESMVKGLVPGSVPYRRTWKLLPGFTLTTETGVDGCPTTDPESEEGDFTLIGCKERNVPGPEVGWVVSESTDTGVRTANSDDARTWSGSEETRISGPIALWCSSGRPRWGQTRRVGGRTTTVDEPYPEEVIPRGFE